MTLRSDLAVGLFDGLFCNHDKKLLHDGERQRIAPLRRMRARRRRARAMTIQQEDDQRRREEQDRVGPILGGDCERQEARKLTTTVVGEGREPQKNREAARSRERTLQLTDDQIMRAQAESGLVQRLLASGEHRGTSVMRRHGLVLVQTPNGRCVVLPPSLWSVVFKECHDSVWASIFERHIRMLVLLKCIGGQARTRGQTLGIGCGSRKARPREVIPPLRRLNGGDGFGPAAWSGQQCVALRGGRTDKANLANSAASTENYTTRRQAGDIRLITMSTPLSLLVAAPPTASPAPSIIVDTLVELSTRAPA
ncbi:hypothetical protein GQ600_19111 [Phytophthora cactorum]|nr:hypothetical protein GQ600_19111 [Phytophthora cactorum]